MPLYITNEPISHGYKNYQAIGNKEVEELSKWYPDLVEEIPRVYHRYVSKSSQTYKDLYPEFVENTVSSISELTTFINESKDDIIDVRLVADINVPKRDDGRITTVFVPAGKTLIINLGGHTWECDAYALYIYGKAIIKGSGTIKTRLHNTYCALQVTGANASVEVTDNVVVDTRTEDDPVNNWMYGIFCSSGAVATVSGNAKIICGAAAALSTNNTTGMGNFYVKDNAQLIAEDCSAIYMASMDIIDITDNAQIIGGIIARMGHINVSGNAKVIARKALHINGGYDDLGSYLANNNGCCALPFALYHAAGTYKGNGVDGSNDFVFTVSDKAKLSSADEVNVCIANLGTGYDQVSDANLVTGNTWKVIEWDEANTLATASGVTLKAKIATTTINITVDGEVVYPETKE
jgi:hypothetical protein